MAVVLHQMEQQGIAYRSRKRKDGSWRQYDNANAYHARPPQFKRSKHRNFRPRPANQHDHGQPSLAALRRANRERTRKYFSGRDGRSQPATTPRTVPRAPENTTSFIIAEHLRPSPSHDDTSEAGDRGPNWTNGYQTLDQDAANLGVSLDFFGTNEGLITRRDLQGDSTDSDYSSDGAEDHSNEELREYELHFSGDEADLQLPRHVKARLEDQASYIAQLEDENLNLRERIFLLEQELAETSKPRDMDKHAVSDGEAEPMSKDGHVQYTAHIQVDDQDQQDHQDAHIQVDDQDQQDHQDPPTT